MTTTKRKPSISIRFGALHNDITVNGVKFDRRELGRDGLNQLSRMCCEALINCGFMKRAKREDRRMAA